MADGYDTVIVGAGHAGAHLALSLRQRRYRGTIGLLSDENCLPYERPPLSKECLAGTRSLDGILIRSAGAWAAQRIDLNSGSPVAVSHSGTSVGHWEGGTLVVETTGFDGGITFIPPFKYGRNTERISLKGPGVLEVALTMTAPDIFSGPFQHTYTYRRDPKHAFFEYTTCVEDDRSVDPKSQLQRFDLTPPEDLPPPPKE